MRDYAQRVYETLSTHTYHTQFDPKSDKKSTHAIELARVAFSRIKQVVIHLFDVVVDVIKFVKACIQMKADLDAHIIKEDLEETQDAYCVIMFENGEAIVAHLQNMMRLVQLSLDDISITRYSHNASQEADFTMPLYESNTHAFDVANEAAKKAIKDAFKFRRYNTNKQKKLKNSTDADLCVDTEAKLAI